MKKILIVSSNTFYKEIPKIKEKLEAKGYKVYFSDSYKKTIGWASSEKEHKNNRYKALKSNRRMIINVDAVLCLNFDKGLTKNYIGGTSFIKLYEAFINKKKIYLWNPIPKGILYNEILDFSPKILNGDIDKLK